MTPVKELSRLVKLGLLPCDAVVSPYLLYRTARLREPTVPSLQSTRNAQVHENVPDSVLGARGGGNCANVNDAFCNERWACRETHPVGTPFKTFDHGGTTYYHASRNCGQACVDDDASISYGFVVKSQADSCTAPL